MLAPERQCCKCICVNTQEINPSAAKFANTKLGITILYDDILCNTRVSVIFKINHYEKVIRFFTTGFRPYKCPHCSYTAIQSSSYKNHLKSRHPLLSGLFTCDLCPFKTVKNESYIQHLGDHEKGLIKSNVQKKGNIKIYEIY